MFLDLQYPGVISQQGDIRITRAGANAIFISVYSGHHQCIILGSITNFAGSLPDLQGYLHQRRSDIA
jgi:hypothetical protein